MGSKFVKLTMTLRFGNQFLMMMMIMGYQNYICGTYFFIFPATFNNKWFVNHDFFYYKREKIQKCFNDIYFNSYKILMCF